ncbi:ABC transporter ATP-binding protein [Ectothiorhodospiraceae bacterium 2226]|nr:ABC transporter ATP-binding protein [Ectothiorhodospiraceae bacterium 2226]
MLDTYRKLHDLLDRRERRQALLLFMMMLVMGLLEALGVASIMPFIAVLANPELINTNPVLNAVYVALGFSNTHTFLMFLGFIVFAVVVGSLSFQALTHWVMARFANMRNFSISSRLLSGYLARPYSWFLRRHSSDLGKTVLDEVQQVISHALMPALQLVASLIAAIFLVALVVVVEPTVALVALVVLGGTYALIYLALRKYLRWIGEDRLIANRERFRIAHEALGGIKEVKVLGLENAQLRAFRKPALRFARRQATNQIISELPHFALQALVFGGMVILLLTMLAARDGNLTAALPLLALYAFAGYRLMPALQKVYRSMTKLRFGEAPLKALHDDVVATGIIQRAVDAAPLPPPPEPIRLRKELELREVSYSYPGAARPALSKIEMSIPARTTVGIVGSTGAGKTTVVDLILGLLSADAGELRVDGSVITPERVRAWQQSLGYVPQSIFLTDDTVAGNIAFGVPPDQIDMAAVERAARIAELHDLVVNDMPEGYATEIGERGVRLSGGQRQRIGIARALYHDPDVLILDEATSALDNLTERAVMDAVHNLGHRKTIILIAHRLTTVRECDTIFLLEHGRVSESGTYNQLLANSQRFKAMAATA